MTITLHIITGTIDTTAFNKPISCGQDRPSKPRLKKGSVDYTVEHVQKMLIQNTQPEEGDTAFWAVRTIFYFALQSNFISITKIPFVLTEPRMLFVNRDGLSVCTGFFAPFLSEEARRYLGCVEQADQTNLIDTPGEMLHSISGETESIQGQLAVLLTCFLQDELTAMIGFTYKRANGVQTTRFWYKKIAVEPRSGV